VNEEREKLRLACVNTRAFRATDEKKEARALQRGRLVVDVVLLLRGSCVV
jgi:hypothetical protein